MRKYFIRKQRGGGGDLVLSFHDPNQLHGFADYGVIVLHTHLLVHVHARQGKPVCGGRWSQRMLCNKRRLAGTMLYI